jgi:hypothetical protein
MRQNPNVFCIVMDLFLITLLAHCGSFRSKAEAMEISHLQNSTEADDLEHSYDTSETNPSEGVSLGEILGLLFLVCCILYCIGIAYKIFKIFKGTYVEEEPVFLKYK